MYVSRFRCSGFPLESMSPVPISMLSLYIDELGPPAPGLEPDAPPRGLAD